MNQPLYIAPDEEIISVIARLRTLPDTAVTLVFPKHSVVTQSIINLKLLAREGEKLQKQLTLVSQNENARSLAEKIGFQTLPYTQEMEKGNLYLQSEATGMPSVTSAIKETEEPVIVQEIPEPVVTREIGSQTFNKPSLGVEQKIMGDIRGDATHIQNSQVPITPPLSEPTSLRVRNVTPIRPPGLNSLRTQEQDISSQSTVTPAIFPDFTPDVSSAIPASTQFSSVPPSSAISDFYRRKDVQAVPKPATPPAPQPSSYTPPTFDKKQNVPKKAPAVMVASSVSGKLTKILVTSVIGLVLISGAVVFFLVFPKATAVISAQSITDSYDQSFTVDANTGSEEVPLSKSTTEITVTVPGLASGAANTPVNNSPRAKGKIKVSNNYSSDPQQLVATTRFESNGKIYRIQENITVPGNSSVEVDVIADGSGESYNINEGTFTIPGFKGTDKYEKFSATIVEAISGGGGNETTSSNTFIRADEETMRVRAAEEAKKQFGEKIDNDTDDTYTFVNGLQIERTSEANLPRVGTVPGDYEYSASFKITAYTTSKETVTRAVMKNIRSEYDNITFLPVEQKLSFADFSLSEDSTKASLKVHLDTTLMAELNDQSIKTDLAGKSEGELESFTANHPEVRELTIHFSPAWAMKRIPKDTDKIELVTE